MKVYVGAALALAVLAAGAWRVQVHRERDERRAMARQRIQDRHSLRQIGMLVVAHGKLPMKDGAFDPYHFVRNGELRGSNIRLLRSRRYDRGPTEDEAKNGDYTNFPWERCREARPLGGRPFPLLWEKEPDRDGRMLVVRSDGAVGVWDAETLMRARAEGPVER